MKVSLITATGMRPEAFKLCQLWMSRQRDYWDEHIIVDDGVIPTEIDERDPAVKVIRPNKKWKIGDNTHGRNLSLALSACTGDVIFMIEDDDFFRQDFLSTMLSRLTPRLEMIGETDAIYYHLPTRQWRCLDNSSFSTLAQTAFRRSVIPKLRELLISDKKFFDFQLWRGFHGIRRALHSHSGISIGMKGMPGRPGIGVGHKVDLDWYPDRSLDKLKSLLGSDWMLYAEFINATKKEKSS